MELGENDIELIERYLDNSLSTAEEEEFQARVSTSDDFAKEFNFQRKVLAQIQAEEKAELKAKMLSDFRRVTSEQQTQRWYSGKAPWYLAAASLLLISVFYFILGGDADHKEVFSSYYQAYDGVVVPRGDDQSITDGLQAYNDLNFSKALNIFLALESYDISEGQLQLLIGNCYLNLNQAGEGLRIFQGIEAAENANVLNNRDWYMALTLISLNQLADAKDLLSKIVNSNSIYAIQARALLEEAIFE